MSKVWLFLLFLGTLVVDTNIHGAVGALFFWCSTFWWLEWFYIKHISKNP